MMRNMRPARVTSIVSVIVLLGGLIAGSGAQALAAGGAYRAAPPPNARLTSARLTAARLTAARLRAADTLALSAALLGARSAPGTAQGLMRAELAEIEPGGLPVPSSLADLESGCSIDEGGGAGFGSSSADAAAVSTAVSSPRSILTELLPAGDLDNKPGPDVIDYRLGSTHDAIVAGLTARSGRTGTPLWSRKVTGAKDQLDIPFPDPDRIGPTKAPGVLLIDESDPLVGDGTVTLSVRAISGAGVQLWSHTLSGQITVSGDTETLTNVPVFVGDVHDVAGAGHDLLIDVVNGSATEKGEAGSDQPEVMSARDGSLTDRGVAVSSTSGLPEVVPVTDLNGDGLEDLAVIDPGPSGGIIAERADTGAVIWTSPAMPVDDGAQLAPVGFVSGPQAQDLAVTTVSDRGVTSVSLIDGASGKLLWTHRALCAFEIDKAGPRLQPAVGLLTNEKNGSSRKYAEAGVSLSPRGLHGKVVFRRSVLAKATTPKAADSTSFTLELTTFGDVEPDGGQDVLVALSASVGTTTARRHGVLTARGAPLIVEPFGDPTDGGLRRGHGTDLVKPVTDKGGFLLAAYNAATGNVLYQQQIADTRGLRPELSYGIRVTGHHCSDLVIEGASKTKELIGLFDAKAQPLWTVTAAGGKLRGGHLHLSKPPAAYCVA
jgi:hypothetical protein